MTVSLALSLVGVIGLVLAWTLFQWAKTSDALADAFATIDTIDQERAAAVQERNRYRSDATRAAYARLGQKLSSRLNATSVVRAGVLAAIAEMQRTSAADHSARTVDLAANAIAVHVDGDVNVLALVPAVIAAVDQAIVDLDLDEAALAAANALEGGEAAPIEDVLASLRGDPAIRVLPIKKLSDLAAESRDGSFGGLVDRRGADRPFGQDPAGDVQP